jgi:hypothetical protein
VTEFEVRKRTTAGSLRCGREKLLEAHAELEAAGADLGPLTKILGIALALDGLAANAEAEVVQASRTAGGLSAKVALLSQQLRSAEDELGRLRPENQALRARVEQLEAPVADKERLAVALDAVTHALHLDSEHVRRASRERAAGEASRAVGAHIAHRIRAELVCCDQYGKTHDGLTYEQSKAAVAGLKRGRGYHDLCYWGEAAARLAEDRPDGFADESGPEPDPQPVSAEFFAELAVAKAVGDGGPVCPTECDADCDASCHEGHFVPWKRQHPEGSCAERPA